MRHRIVSSLIRAASVINYCQRGLVAYPEFVAEVDRAGSVSLDQCIQAIRAQLAERGFEMGSREHLASVRRLPMQEGVSELLAELARRDVSCEVTPLELLQEFLRTDEALAANVARMGVTVDGIGAELEERQLDTGAV